MGVETVSVVITRTKLDIFLEDPTLTLLLLFADTPVQRALAGAADAISANQPWRQAVVVTDLRMLTQSETKLLEASADRYAVLGAGDDEARVLAVAGPSGDLLLQNGSPSNLRLKRAFALGDQT